MAVLYKMLVIDDEYLVRLGIQKTIPWEKYGIQIVGEAANGQQGLELALELSPDIIICDVRMPLMDGLEFVQRVNELELDCVMVMLSGYKDFDYAKESLEGGAFAYLLKPIDNHELVQTVLGALEHLKKKRASAVHYEHLQKALPSMAEKLLLDLITGDFTQAETLRETIRMYELPLPEQGYLVYGQIDSVPDLDFSKEQQGLKELYNQIHQVLEEQNVTHFGSVFESSVVFLVPHSLEQKMVEQLCQAGVERYESYEEAVVSVGISQIYSHLEGIQEAHKQAKQATGRKLFPTINTVASFGTTATQYKPQVLEAMEFIAENYHKNVTVKMVADSLYVSESYLMHLFRDNVGKTFNECLVEYRMLMAKKLLQEGKLRVYEIAHRVGYSDPKYFSQIFRRHVGVPPSQYGDEHP